MGVIAARLGTCLAIVPIKHIPSTDVANISIFEPLVTVQILLLLAAPLATASSCWGRNVYSLNRSINMWHVQCQASPAGLLSAPSSLATPTPTASSLSLSSPTSIITFTGRRYPIICRRRCLEGAREAITGGKRRYILRYRRRCRAWHRVCTCSHGSWHSHPILHCLDVYIVINLHKYN